MSNVISKVNLILIPALHQQSKQFILRLARSYFSLWFKEQHFGVIFWFDILFYNIARRTFHLEMCANVHLSGQKSKVKDVKIP